MRVLYDDYLKLPLLIALLISGIGIAFLLLITSYLVELWVTVTLLLSLVTVLIASQAPVQSALRHRRLGRGTLPRMQRYPTKNLA